MSRLNCLLRTCAVPIPAAHAFTAAATLAVGLLAGTASHAQVHRCTDAQGHVTYTNAPCAAGQAAVVVQPALSAQERAQQQAQYEQALQRREAERAASAQRAAEAQAQSLQDERLRASQAAQAAAERAAQAQQAAAQAAADAAAARAAQPTVLPAWGGHGPRPAPPPHRPPHARPQPGDSATGTWSCNVFRCTDGRGNTRPVP